MKEQIFTVIDKFDGEYRFLSNFYPAEVHFEGMIYPSSEHAYQAAKYLDYRDKLTILGLTAGRAKRYRSVTPLRADWEDVKVQIMLQVVYDKFSRNPDLAKMLIETGEAILIEGNHWGDCFWGVCNGKGANMLGLILMFVRAKLKLSGKEIR